MRLIILMLTVVIILASLSQGIIALFVFLKQRNNATNLLFSLLSISLIAWAITSYAGVSVPQTVETIHLIRLVMFFVVFQNTLFLLFSAVFPKRNFSLSLKWILYIGFSALVLADSLSPYLFTSAVISNNTASPVPGPGIILFIIHAIISIIGTFWILIRKFRLAKGIQKAQLKYLLLGMVLLLLVVPITNFVVTLVAHTTIFVRVAPIYTLIFSSLIAYVIVRHRFLDIRLIIARTVAYILILGTLAGTYSAAIFGISSTLFPDSTSDIRQSLLNIALAMVLAFTFQPLRRFFEQLTDRIFYRNKYDSQVVLRDIGKILASEIIIEKLLNKSLKVICESLHVEMGQFMIFEGERVYKIEHYGPLPKRMLVGPEAQKLRQSILVVDELEGGERKEIMSEHCIRTSVMLRTKGEFVGFLLLGDKLSGDVYSDQDVNLLNILANELAVAIVNAKAYAEIEQFNMTLVLRIKEATASLRSANRNLKVLDKSKDEFISMASHQLRTPLTTIKGYLSMMLEGDAGAMTAEQKEFTGYAFDGAQRMVGLVSDLLNVSRLEAGRFMIEKQPTDLVEVVEDEIRQLAGHAQGKQIQLIFDRPQKQMPLVEIDENKTRQVIMNFIDNAIYYTKQGSVRVSIGVDEGRVWLRVKDTGIGVPKDAEKSLFTRFFRAENAQVARPDGTGLGLYLAKRVIEDHGGSIIFESVLNQGSTFGFSIPLPIDQQKKPKAEKSAK